MAIDIIARGMIESSKNDISQLFDITKGGEIVNNESSYTLNNTVDYPLLGMNLYGKSTQDGVPTPENPVEIVSVGDSGSVEVQTCGKNLFPWNDYTTVPISRNNLSADKVVINSNVIKMNIPQADDSKNYGVYINQSHTNKILFGQTGKVITLSCEVKSNYNVRIAFGLDYYKETFDSTTNRMSVTLTYNSSKNTSICWYVINASNDTEIQISNIQIEIGDTATEYEPYKGTTAAITSALPLCGIPVDSGGNYTDSNGQQWICDELVYNADGTGKIVKRTNGIIFNGSENWKLSGANKKRIYVSVEENLYPKFVSNITKAYLFCNKYIAGSSDDTYIATKTCIGISKDLDFHVYDERFSGDVEGLKADMAANNLRVVYALNTPSEIELTAAEMAALRQLQTFDGVSNASNDSGADMSVKYCTNKALSEFVYPITTGLQKQIDELKAAVISLGGNV